MNSPAGLAQVLVDRLLVEVATTRPLFVALDGRSGAGKSTLAAATAELLTDTDGSLRAGIIAGDDFYAGGSPASWDLRTPHEKAERVIDWRRQRLLLTELQSRGVAEWRPFDWDSADWDAETVPLRERPERLELGDVAILEGAYSARPQLADLIDLRVLLDTPTDIRRARLLARDGDDYHLDWDLRWSVAEEHYFAVVMPPEGFDLVLQTHDAT